MTEKNEAIEQSDNVTGGGIKDTWAPSQLGKERVSLYTLFIYQYLRAVDQHWYKHFVPVFSDEGYATYAPMCCKTNCHSPGGITISKVTHLKLIKQTFRKSQRQMEDPSHDRNSWLSLGLQATALKASKPTMVPWGATPARTSAEVSELGNFQPTVNQIIAWYVSQKTSFLGSSQRVASALPPKWRFILPLKTLTK